MKHRLKKLNFLLIRVENEPKNICIKLETEKQISVSVNTFLK